MEGREDRESGSGLRRRCGGQGTNSGCKRDQTTNGMTYRRIVEFDLCSSSQPVKGSYGFVRKRIVGRKKG